MEFPSQEKPGIDIVEEEDISIGHIMMTGIHLMKLYYK
jgi:hypothetical protein